VSSAALDRANSVLYAEAGIKEYWIVLGRDRKIEVYRRPENGRYLEQHLFGEADNLQCSAIPAVLFRVADLFA
jgi:Uma2 family endonuclease